MVNVDLRQLLGKLNFYCTNTLNNAAGLCVSRTNYEVTVEHWLIKCLESRDGDLAVLLDNNQEIISLLMKELNQSLDSNAGGNGGKPSFSPRLTDLLSDAWLIASVDLGLAQIRSGAVILAILEHPMVYGQEGWFKALKTLNSEKLKANFATYTAKSVESITPTAQDGVAADGSEKKGASANGGFIERFCQDFTKKAAEGKLDPVFGRDNEIRQMVDILARRRKNNPILVGEPGVGKTAVLEGLALRIVEGDVPEILKDVQLIGLDMGLLEAGAGVKGEFENRLKGVIQEIQSSTRPIILFIDEAHTLIGAGGSAGTSDAANLLKPALARGELKTCAATTWSEYKKYFEKDPALARRFQLVKLAEPSVDTTALILRGLKASYEKSHKVVIRDDSLQTAAEYADRYITARFLPDKAIDLVDTACARVKVNLKAMPGSVEDLRRKSQALKRQISSLQRDIDNDVAVDADKLANLEAELKANDISFEEANANWQKELEAVNAVVEARAKLHEARSQANKELSEGEEAIDLDEALANVKEKSEALAKIQGKDPLIHYEVTPDLIAQVVSDWTGIPLGRMARDELSTVLKLDEILQTKVKGQNVGIKTLTTVIRNAKSGLKNPEQPLGVFLLVGPSGVGKTETAINLAEQLFGSERSLITINMSEYQEKHTVSRLVGSPPGYVGYGEVAVDNDGFIRRWLILEPISKPSRTNAIFTDSYLKRVLCDTTYFANQFTMTPKDGQTVKVGKDKLKWHALDSKNFNVKLFRLSYGLQKPIYGVLYWNVTVINSDKEIKNVRMAVGSNSGSQWWLNGEPAIMLSNDRRMVKDDCVSPRMTLKKGKNIVRGAVINGPGMSDFCVRFIDENGEPVKGITVSYK